MSNKNVTGKTAIVLANFENTAIEMIRGNAYCNLNGIAKLYNKRVDNWMRLKGTKQLFVAFEKQPRYRSMEAIISRKGQFSDTSDLRYHSENIEGQGTWAHPDIAIQFAQWCSPEFALWVSSQIRHLLEYGEVNIHHEEWTIEQYDNGMQLNRDDIKSMYG